MIKQKTEVGKNFFVILARVVYAAAVELLPPFFFVCLHKIVVVALSALRTTAPNINRNRRQQIISNKCFHSIRHDENKNETKDCSWIYEFTGYAMVLGFLCY